MLIVLDTNVLVSGLMKSGSIPAQILSLILKDEVDLAASKTIFAEYWAVLKRPKFETSLELGKVEKLMGGLRRKAYVVEPRMAFNATPSDPSDSKFLDCAVEAEADFLITGNIKHFTFKIFQKIKIVSPREFMEIILP